MDIVNILLTLLFGAIAGWLAGFFVVKDKGGLIWNIIIGLSRAPFTVAPSVGSNDILSLSSAGL